MKFRDVIKENNKEYKYLEVLRPNKEIPEYIEYVIGKISKNIYYISPNIKMENLLKKTGLPKWKIYNFIDKNPPNKNKLNFWEKDERELKAAKDFYERTNRKPEIYLIISKEKITGRYSKEIYYEKGKKTSYYDKNIYPDEKTLKDWARNETHYIGL